MKVAALDEVRNRLSRYVAEVDRGPVIITKNGKAKAALVTLEGQDLETFVLAHTPRFLARLDRAAQRAQQHGIPFREVEAEVKTRTKQTRKTRSRSGR
jgi:prevent-host-death family protein